MLAVASERTFQDLARAAGRPDWIDDPRFAVYANRRLNWHLFMDELEHWSRQLATDECQAAFERFGVPSSRYRTVEEAMTDAQLAHRDAFHRRCATPPARSGRSTRRSGSPDAPAAARPFRLAPRRAQRRGARRDRLYPGGDRRVSQGRHPRLSRPPCSRLAHLIRERTTHRAGE
jgi:crotonobetainyl-CoA:carnitine CoA-transferase CaiB-like acyl-CoA transferase